MLRILMLVYSLWFWYSFYRSIIREKKCIFVLHNNFIFLRCCGKFICFSLRFLCNEKHALQYCEKNILILCITSKQASHPHTTIYFCLFFCQQTVISMFALIDISLRVHKEVAWNSWKSITYAAQTCGSSV